MIVDAVKRWWWKREAWAIQHKLRACRDVLRTHGANLGVIDQLWSLESELKSRLAVAVVNARSHSLAKARLEEGDGR